MKLQQWEDLINKSLLEQWSTWNNLQTKNIVQKKLKKIFYKNGWPETITINNQVYSFEYPKILTSKTAEKITSNYNEYIWKSFYWDYFGNAKFIAIDESIKHKWMSPFMSLEIKWNIYDIIIRNSDVNFKKWEKIVFNYLFCPRNSKIDLPYEIKKQIIESLERNIAQWYEMDGII